MSIKYIKSLQIAVRSLTLNERTVSCKTQNHPQTTHKPAKYRTNHPQTSQLLAENQFIYVTKNFSNTAKHVLNLQPFYSISLTFSGEDQNQVGIEEK